MTSFDVGIMLDVNGVVEVGSYDTVVVRNNRDNITDVIEEYYNEDVVIIQDDSIESDSFVVLLLNRGVTDIWTRI